MSTGCPSASIAQVLAPSVQLHASDPLFVTHHVPEDQVGVSKEAIRQAGLMMEQMKVVHEASKDSYDASFDLQTNVKVS